MEILSAAQMREVDRLTIAEHGVDGGTLMAAAAAAVEARLERDFPRALAGRIAVLCGGGNNGGDGLVLTRLLRQKRVRVLCLLFAPAARLRGDAAAALAGVEPPPVEVISEDAWRAQRGAVLGCDLLVDALFGTGLVRPLAGWLRQLVEDVNRNFRGPVVAVDIPSGMGADGEGPAEADDAAVIRATATVTFTAPKRGHYLSRHAAAVGRLSCAAIGTPDAVIETLEPPACRLRLTGPAECRPFLAPRSPDAHKGRFGHVLFIGGSRGKSGAAVLASTAALRIGAGLVTAAVPAGVQTIVAAALPELMTEPLPETPGDGRLAALLEVATVLAVGPGLTQAPAAAALARHIVTTTTLPCVLDADGLNAFQQRRGELRPQHGVLTPHPGEMARLFEVPTAEVQQRRLYYAQRLAGETGAIVVLKGQFTLIASPDGPVYVNPTGNPGMATAGAGDVLTGI
ncbi:MAG TPA: NAD(P)H-hydrate dehydratase, partial [Terriglobales bacterium]|nr:NAD(P)H-hydrate dehydratase [Terriglobales bacterium]